MDIRSWLGHTSFELYVCAYANMGLNGEWTIDEHCFEKVEWAETRMADLLDENSNLGAVVLKINLQGLDRNDGR